ncbi:MAG: hypothetical protein GC200_01365 [Tepidisphaera sp.]|nr:hypothetical protein [Tepidisphaera sp.]
MKRLNVAALVLLGLPLAALAQSGYTITGGLSNFDCGNHCDDPCDEMEIEIEDIRPQDVIHTYHNGNYGSPTVTLSADGLSTIIDYRNPQHLTAVGAIEHFGVSLTNLSPYTPIFVRWKRNGMLATVNGQVPNPGGGTSPATQPMLPGISSDTTWGTTAAGAIGVTVVNNDPAQSIWIQRRATVTQGVVSLEALMPTDPVVTSTLQLDAAPILLGPGQSVTYTNDLLEVEDNQSVVFAATYYQDLFGGGPFNPYHQRGPELGNIMTASIASPDSGCQYSSPVIINQPQSADAAEGHSVDLRVDADGNDLPLSYQWTKDGVDLVNGPDFSGATTDGLTIESLSAATEGFYRVRVMNACGNTMSDSALVFITGHNVPPPPPPPPACDPDVNQDGVADQGDIDYLIDVIAGGDNYTGIDPDFNADGVADQGDIDALINVVAGGDCP